MRFSELAIVTLRQTPNIARTNGQAFLMRAGYINRDDSLTSLGSITIEKFKQIKAARGLPSVKDLGLEIYQNNEDVYLIHPNGGVEVIFCPSCHYGEKADLASFRKTVPDEEVVLPLEEIPTPDCNTIDSLAEYLKIPKSKTAKAMMVVHSGSSHFIFVVIRGDMQFSESKLRQVIGDFRLATMEEIKKAGAEPGYASPIGLKNVSIWVDDLIPKSFNLVAGANKPGFHYGNSNYSRDYVAERILDLSKAKSEFPCNNCGHPLNSGHGLILATRKSVNFENLLLALAEIHHDDKGLCFPQSASPFDLYLMHLPSKELDTKGMAENLHADFLGTDITVLFDDRDERAGVKFNDADLIGLPLRITLGDRNLKNGMVELKLRKAEQPRLVEIKELGKINSRAELWEWVNQITE